MKVTSVNAGDSVDITTKEEQIVIIPLKAKKYSLATLLAGITPENIHQKVDFGAPLGKELI